MIGRADVVVLDQNLRAGDVARFARPDVEVLDAGFGDDGQPLTQASRASSSPARPAADVASHG
nr:hypothetical protein [Angustibacter aerolatus]